MPYIAIDTNIFEHLLNPIANQGTHIDQLLGQLISLHYQLLVDSTRKIGNEYQQMIIPIIRNMDETKPQLPLLRFWMNPDIRHQVELNQQDNLMQQIGQVIYEPSEHADRAFVYVVCREDAILITNDQIHILGRRNDLLRRTRRQRGPNTDIQSSSEAFAHFLDNGEVA
ncbi:MAG: hypothetical protein IAE79_03445 [Anaerolinea sp.]|nr:hypothetical protein [Anaerolinea sp.]